MMKDDMKRVAPLWLKFSKKVRHDPDVSISTTYTAVYGSQRGHGLSCVHPHMRCCIKKVCSGCTA